MEQQEQAIHHCLNCDTEFTGNFCPQCGQKARTQRLQIKAIIMSMFEAILNGDNRFLNTCSQLALRPGVVARNYILGRRASYYAPLSLLLFLVAVYTIIANYMPDAVSPFNVIPKVGATPNEGVSNSMAEVIAVLNAITENKVYNALMGCTMNVLPYTFFFRKQLLKRPDGSMLRLNVAEHFFTLVYLSCINMLLAYIMLPLSFFTSLKSTLSTVSLLLPMVFTIYTYRQLLGISMRSSIRLNVVATVISTILGVSVILMVFGLIGGFEAAME